MRRRGCHSDTTAPAGSAMAATRAPGTSKGARKTAAPPSCLRSLPVADRDVVADAAHDRVRTGLARRQRLSLPVEQARVEGCRRGGVRGGQARPAERARLIARPLTHLLPPNKG